MSKKVISGDFRLEGAALKGCVGVVLLSSLLFVGGCSYGVCQIATSEGFRDGEIQKFSQNWISRTHEGDLALPGSSRGSGAIGNVWHFTATDPKVVKEINELQPFQEVRLYYKKYLWAFLGETRYRITKVEPLIRRR